MTGLKAKGKKRDMPPKSLDDPGWKSMKSDRELIALAKTKTLDAIAEKLHRPPAVILRKAKRLGLSIKRSTKLKMKLGPRPNGRPWTPDGGCAAFGAAGIEDGQAFDRPKTETDRQRHNHSPDGSEGQDEMTDEPHLPRFLIRRGAKRDWMVWDRQTKGPAEYQGHLVVGLPEEQARKIAGGLTKKYIAEG